MAFINSFILYLLPLVTVPLLIHLIGRQRIFQHEFSTLRFLKQLEHDLIRKLKIRQIILLMLRMLIILFIILVFARPYRSSNSPGIYVGKGETLYIILDNSLSMQAEMRGQNLLEIGAEALATASNNIDFPVYVKLIETARPKELLDQGLVTDLVSLKNIIQAVKLTNRRGKIDVAISAIEEDILKCSEISPAIWVISDFQESTWRSENLPARPVESLFGKTDARMILFPVAGDKNNAALMSISMPNQIFEKERVATIRGLVGNWHGKPTETVVALFLDNQKLGQSVLNISAGNHSDIQFEFIPETPGIHKGYLKITDDNLRTDNIRYFLLNIPETIRVLIVTRRPGDSEYIRRSLSLKEMSVIQPKVTSAELFPTEDLTDYDVLIFSNIDRLPPNMLNKIKYFMDMNKGILLFPGQDCNPADFNSFWGNEFGFPKWRDLRQSEDKLMLRIGNFKQEHPLLSNILKEKRSLIYSPDFYVIPGFSVGKNHTVLANYEDNTPFIIETYFEKGSGLLFATSPVDEWSNLHLTGFFPTIMNRAILYLSQQGLREEEFCTGDTIRVSVTQVNNAKDVSIQTPGGRRIMLPIDKSRRFSFADTDEPGIYDISAKGKLIKRLVVNIPAEECGSSFLEDMDFTEVISDYTGRIDVLMPEGDKRSNQLQHRREYSDWLIMFVLALALLESYIGRTNRKLRGKLISG
ncbi:MAG TPA: hypothetical protein DHW42_07300 [Candidatus Marinimicrobia bacterium]|nr:hypothetical protein [Candidatus Neomarinimicrobiota bacterium]